MELTIDKSTHIGLGYSNHIDAFQCGREAAQMAKNQLPTGEADLVFVLCPTGIHFKDFIEGVRLVTGEDKLVGIPVDWVLANGLPTLGSCVVLIVQLSSFYCTITSTQEANSSIEINLTSLLTQCRQLRGSAQNIYEHRGLVLFENRGQNDTQETAKHLITNLSFETWAVGLTPSGHRDNPIVCRNQLVRSGFAAIEFFSNNKMGIGGIGLNSFDSKIDVYREGAKSAVRDALSQLDNKLPAFGLLFIEQMDTPVLGEPLISLFESATSLTHNIPMIMIPVRRQFSRAVSRSTAIQTPSILSILVPR